MVIQETYICKNGHILIRTYSDKNMFIKQIETGEIYIEAYDEPNVYSYEETDIPIDVVVDGGE